MSDAGKAVAVFGFSILALAFAIYVPYWGGSVVDFTNAPALVVQFFQVAFVILFFAGLTKVIGER